MWKHQRIYIPDGGAACEKNMFLPPGEGKGVACQRVHVCKERTSVRETEAPPGK